MGSIAFILWFFRLLFACRVSALSIALAFILFAKVPQSHDIFDDTTYGSLPYSLEAWGHWIWFFFILVVIWALPMYYSARRLLQTDVWMFPYRLRKKIDLRVVSETSSELRTLINYIPRFLGIAPFLVVLIGLSEAYRLAVHAKALPSAREACNQILVLAAIDLMVALLFSQIMYFGRVVTSTIRYEIQTVTAIMYVMIVTVIFIVSYGHPFFPSDAAPRACVVPIVFGSFVFIGTFLAWLGSKISMPVLSMSIIGAFSVTGMNMHFHDVRTIASERNGFSKRQIDIGYAVQKWKIDAKVFEFVAEQEFARSDFAWRLPPVF